MSVELNSRMELRLASLTLKFSVVLPVQVLSTQRFSPMARGIRKQGNLLESGQALRQTLFPEPSPKDLGTGDCFGWRVTCRGSPCRRLS